MDKDCNQSELATLSEFKSLSGFSDSELISLLSRGKLAIETSETGSILVRLDEIDLPGLVLDTIPQKKYLEDDNLKELIASEVLSALDEIVDEAILLSKKWINQK